MAQRAKSVANRKAKGVSGTAAAAKRAPAKRATAKKSASKARTTGQTAQTSARQDVINTARAMSQQGLSPGRSGNVSMRWQDGMLITPSGMPYDALEPRDIVYIAGDGAVDETARKPSSEWRFHLGAYKARKDRDAVVHTHSLRATVLACQHRPIPAFHYMVAAAGGKKIPCVPYAAFGTEELAAHVAKGLKKHDACLMANHGQIAIGTTLASALELAAEVENLAAQYVQVLSLGKPKLLSSKQMDDVLKRFQNYGQKAQGD